jgi:hypothetical protein
MVMFSRQISAIAVLVIAVLTTSCGESDSKISEHEFFLLQQSQCIVRASAQILNGELTPWPKSLPSVSDLVAIVSARTKQIQCGPSSGFIKKGEIIDSYDDPIQFVVRDDSVIVFSKNVPFRLGTDTKQLFGLVVSHNKIFEIQLNEKGQPL